MEEFKWLIKIVAIILGAGVLSWLVGKAPVVEDQYKGIAKFFILVVAVIWLLIIVFRWAGV